MEGSTSIDGASPAAAQPANIADPIRPAPKQQDGRDGRGHASPTHSSMAASSASAGVLPPHSTNWKAG